MPIITTHVLAGHAVGDINMNGHNLLMNVGILALDSSSFLSSDGSGNLLLAGSSITTGTGILINGGLTLNSQLNMGGNSIADLSELDFADSTVQSTAA